MDIDIYASHAATTAIYPREFQRDPDPELPSLIYCGLKLCGESGEVAEHIGKILRDDGGKITDDRRQKLAKEIGDVAWYFVRICHHLGYNPSEILKVNVAKLAKRAAEGKIQGSGSDR